MGEDGGMEAPTLAVFEPPGAVEFVEGESGADGPERRMCGSKLKDGSDGPETVVSWRLGRKLGRAVTAPGTSRAWAGACCGAPPSRPQQPSAHPPKGGAGLRWPRPSRPMHGGPHKESARVAAVPEEWGCGNGKSVTPATVVLHVTDETIPLRTTPAPYSPSAEALPQGPLRRSPRRSPTAGEPLAGAT